MTPSQIVFEFQSLDRQLFLANMVDRERRLELALTDGIDIWSTLSRYLEEDTGLYIHPQALKPVTYAGLYGAGINTLISIAESAEITLGEYDEVGPEEIAEIQTWLFQVSDSPYFLRTGATGRISHVNFMRNIQRRVYERYGDRCRSIYFDWDKIEIGLTIFNQATLDRMSNDISRIIDSYIEELNLGFTTGLYKSVTVAGER